MKMSFHMNIAPPEAFNFEGGDFKTWLGRWDKFRKISGLDEDDEEKQVQHLLYVMGQKSEDLITRLQLSKEDLCSYEIVVEKLEEHFSSNINVTYERTRFFSRNQKPEEKVEEFINDLYKRAEKCAFKNLKNDLIMHQIIIGIKDRRLSEVIQNDCLSQELSLKLVEERVKKSEMVREQQVEKQNAEHFVDVVRDKKQERSRDPCRYCGMRIFRDHRCKARFEICHRCQKKGHYAAVCPKKTQVTNIEEGVEELHLGEFNSINPSSSWMAHLHVGEVKLKFKIDTGADVSVISEDDFHLHFSGKTLRKFRSQLYGPGRMRIQVIGTFHCQLRYKDHAYECEIFVIKGPQIPLLGRPAIAALNIFQFIGSLDVKGLEDQFPDIFKGIGVMHGEYEIKLKPNAEPHAIQSPRRVPFHLMDKVKEELKKLEVLGVIQKVTEPTDWVAGMVVVPKPNGDVRICVDYNHLNQNIRRERLMLPSVTELLLGIRGAKYFTKLDCRSGYYQCRLKPSCAKLTTFITPFGRFFFNRIPMGISSAPEHYHRRMASMFEEIEGVITYLDDNLVFGATKQEHDERLFKVLQKLKEEGVTLNKDKCEFGVSSVKFLGFNLSAEGIKPDNTKIEAIIKMERPENIDELRRFLGMINYHSRFYPNLSEKAEPLRLLLKKNILWTWDENMNRIFEEIKEMMSTTPVLAYFDASKPIRVSADGSLKGLGGMLEQETEIGKWKPVAFASRSLTDAEKRYSNIERETLAVVWCCERFADMLIGTQFIIRTDHKPLVSLLGNIPLADLTARIQRMRMRLMKFTYRIEHIPGKELFTPDTLSRIPLPVSEDFQDVLQQDVDAFVNVMYVVPASDQKLKEILNKQQEDEGFLEMKRYLTGQTNELRTDGAKQMKKYESQLWHKDEILMFNHRLVIPPSMRKEILDKIHEAHGGENKCINRAKTCVWWPGINRDIQNKAQNCSKCVENRSNCVEPMISSTLPTRPWEILGMDHFKCNGNWYLMIADQFSRFLEVILVKEDLSTAKCIEVLRKLFSYFGIPVIIRCDGAQCFISTAMKTFSHEYGFQIITSSPEYPRSNGFSEAMVKSAKNIILKGGNLEDTLLAYRTSPNESGFSPAELLLGRKLRTKLPIHPDELIPKWPDLNKFNQEIKERKLRQEENYNRRHGTRLLSELHPGDNVWVTNLHGYGKVYKKLPQPRSYLVDVNGKYYRRNRWHLIKVQDSTNSKEEIRYNYNYSYGSRPKDEESSKTEEEKRRSQLDINARASSTEENSNRRNPDLTWTRSGRVCRHLLPPPP